jgi:hypothetical protein
MAACADTLFILFIYFLLLFDASNSKVKKRVKGHSFHKSSTLPLIQFVYSNSVNSRSLLLSLQRRHTRRLQSFNVCVRPVFRVWPGSRLFKWPSNPLFPCALFKQRHLTRKPLAPTMPLGMQSSRRRRRNTFLFSHF